MTRLRVVRAPNVADTVRHETRTSLGGSYVADLIDIVKSSGTAGRTLHEAVEEHVAGLVASARRGKRERVYAAERAVRVGPAKAFAFDDAGVATLTAAGEIWQSGRFETPTLAELRKRCVQPRRTAAPAAANERGIRLWVLDGASPATDIASLQATSGNGTLFQVASQFNCLESPGRT